MPQERLSKQTLNAEVSGKRSVEQPTCLDYIEGLGWNRLRLRPRKMQFVVLHREVCRLNRELLPPHNPQEKSGEEKKKTQVFLLIGSSYLYKVILPK